MTPTQGKYTGNSRGTHKGAYEELSEETQSVTNEDENNRREYAGRLKGNLPAPHGQRYTLVQRETHRVR